MEMILEKYDGKLLKFKVVGEDHTVLNALREKLISYPEVEYAYYTLSHPLKNPYLLLPDNVTVSLDSETLRQEAEFVLRVKEGDPRETLKKAVEELLDEAKQFVKLVDKIYKEKAKK